MNDNLFTSQTEEMQTLQGAQLEWFGIPYYIPAPIPHTTFINDLRNNQYKLKQALPVLVQEESIDSFVVSVEDLEVYAQGDTKYNAMDNLRKAIVDLYNFYLQNQDALINNELRIWEHMKEVISYVQSN